jgi:hypothetical protein
MNIFRKILKSIALIPTGVAVGSALTTLDISSALITVLIFSFCMPISLLIWTGKQEE